MSRDLVVGHILGAFGVKGWVKVKSETDPPENILRYSPWRVDDGETVRECRVIDGKRHSIGVVARLEGVSDRNLAMRLTKATITVSRDKFPALRRGQYYWADLIGLEVRTEAGLVLGRVVDMLATGANDVMEVEGDRNRLIPFIHGDFVKTVQLEEGYLTVDWDPDF